MDSSADALEILCTEIDYMSSFYSNLAYLAMGKYLLVVDSSFVDFSRNYDAISNTLSSMSLLFQRGCYADAITLLRRLDDFFILDTYIMSLLQMDSLKVSADFSKFLKTKENQLLRGWGIGSVNRTKLPRRGVMIDVIKNWSGLSDLDRLLEKSGTFLSVHKWLNDFVHANAFSHIVMNSEGVLPADAKSIVKQCLQIVRCLSVQHISYMLMLNPTLVSSEDYMMAMDDGEQPSKGMQYLVAPFVQEMFDHIFHKRREDIAQYILHNMPVPMGLE